MDDAVKKAKRLKHEATMQVTRVNSMYVRTYLCVCVCACVFACTSITLLNSCIRKVCLVSKKKFPDKIFPIYLCFRKVCLVGKFFFPIYLYLYLSIYIYPSIHLSIYLSIYPVNNEYSFKLIYVQCICLPCKQAINSSSSYMYVCM